MPRTNDDSPSESTALDDFDEYLIAHVTKMARELRSEGADVPVNAGIDATKAVLTVGVMEREKVKIALRSTLISRETDLDIFDRLFPRFWERFIEERDIVEDHQGLEFLEQESVAAREEQGNHGGSENADGTNEQAPVTTADEDDENEDPDLEKEGSDVSPGGTPAKEGGDEVGASVRSATYSRVGNPTPITLQDVEDTETLTEAVNRLATAIENLKGRRWNSVRYGEQIDARRALRESYGTGGIVPTIPYKSRRRSAVRAVVLVDVSQSVLDTVDRGFLLRFLQTSYHEWRDVRVFFFDTSVREVTNRFAGQSIAEVLLALREAEAEWGGGTRIGHAFETIRRDYPYAIDREATLFVISDGLEADDIERLREEMANVSRRSNAILWLNPLAASTEYQPTCRGMAAALPYVDGLFAFAEESDVDEIARQLRLRGIGGPIGYEYDQREQHS